MMITFYEKWKENVKIQSTGEYKDKSPTELRKMIKQLKGKRPFTDKDREKLGELLFALRAKTGWKKGKGATGL